MKFLYLAIAILFLTNCTSNKKSKENKKEEIVRFDPNDPNTWSEEYKKSMDSLVNRNLNANIALNDERTEKYIDSCNRVIDKNIQEEATSITKEIKETINMPFGPRQIKVATEDDLINLLNTSGLEDLLIYRNKLKDFKKNLKLPENFTKKQKANIIKLIDDKIKLCYKVLEEKKTQSAPQ